MAEEKNVLQKVWAELLRWKDVGLTIFAVTWLIKEVVIPVARTVIENLLL